MWLRSLTPRQLGDTSRRWGRCSGSGGGRALPSGWIWKIASVEFSGGWNTRRERGLRVTSRFGIWTHGRMPLPSTKKGKAEVRGCLETKIEGDQDWSIQKWGVIRLQYSTHVQSIATVADLRLESDSMIDVGNLNPAAFAWSMNETKCVWNKWTMREISKNFIKFVLPLCYLLETVRELIFVHKLCIWL